LDPFDDSATEEPKVVAPKPARKTKVKPTRDAIVAERSVIAKVNFGKRKTASIIDTEPEDSECVDLSFLLVNAYPLSTTQTLKEGQNF
jgi:hypothetical protein